MTVKSRLLTALLAALLLAASTALAAAPTTFIEQQIRHEVERFDRSVRRENARIVRKRGADAYKINAWTSVDVRCDNDRFYSVTIDEVTYTEGAAHPMTIRRGMTFDRHTGALLRRKDVADATVTKEQLTERLRDQAADRIYTDLRSVDRLPDEFFLDRDEIVHVIFQPYDVGPYSSGVIELRL